MSKNSRRLVVSIAQFNDNQLTWANWRQFVSKNPKPEIRKEVFDLFVRLTPKIAPYIEKRFIKSREIFNKYNLNIAEAYSIEENIPLEKVRTFVTDLKKQIKPLFEKYLKEHSKSFLGKEIEYYDDYYFVRNNIMDIIQTEFSHLDPIEKVKKIVQDLNFNFDAIGLDDKDRPEKNPSASCWPINVPEDVRVLYKKEAPFNTFKSVYHEYGHAIHFISIKKQLPFWERYFVPTSLAETFSRIKNILQGSGGRGISLASQFAAAHFGLGTNSSILEASKI